MTTTTTGTATTPNAQLQVQLRRFREWSADWDRVSRDEPHSRRAWDDLYDSGIDLLRDLAHTSGLLLPGDEAHVQVQPCAWCSTEMRWHAGAGLWQGAAGISETPTVWTDRCPIAKDHRHEPAPTPSPGGAK